MLRGPRKAIGRLAEMDSRRSDEVRWHGVRSHRPGWPHALAWREHVRGSVVGRRRLLTSEKLESAATLREPRPPGPTALDPPLREDRPHLSFSMSNDAPQLDVLYDNGPCLVVNKPPGVLTQAPVGIDSLEVRVKAFYRDWPAGPSDSA